MSRSESSGQRDDVTSRLPSWLVTAGAASWRLLAMLGVAWVALEILGSMRLLSVSFAIGLVVTALLYPLARVMGRRYPRSVRAIVPVVLLIGLVTTVIVFFARGLIRQWDALVQSVLRGWAQIRRLLSETPVALDETTLPEIGQRMETEEIARHAFRTVYTTAEIITGMFLVLVIVFFLLRDGDRIGELLLRLFPEDRRDRARAASHGAWHTLERYVVGIAIVSAINTILTGLALLVLRIPMVVPLVLFTFVACFIPFIGTVVATGAGALIALAERGPKIALFFVLAGVAIEVLESNVTQPLVQGRVLHVHPLLVVGFVTAGTVMFGLPGAFLAVPLLAVLYGIATGLRRHREEHDSPNAPEPRPAAEAEQPA